MSSLTVHFPEKIGLKTLALGAALVLTMMAVACTPSLYSLRKATAGKLPKEAFSIARTKCKHRPTHEACKAIFIELCQEAKRNAQERAADAFQRRAFSAAVERITDMPPECSRGAEQERFARFATDLGRCDGESSEACEVTVLLAAEDDVTLPSFARAYIDSRRARICSYALRQAGETGTLKPRTADVPSARVQRASAAGAASRRHRPITAQARIAVRALTDAYLVALTHCGSEERSGVRDRLIKAMLGAVRKRGETHDALLSVRRVVAAAPDDVGFVDVASMLEAKFAAKLGAAVERFSRRGLSALAGRLLIESAGELKLSLTIPPPRRASILNALAAATSWFVTLDVRAPPGNEALSQIIRDKLTTSNQPLPAGWSWFVHGSAGRRKPIVALMSLGANFRVEHRYTERTAKSTYQSGTIPVENPEYAKASESCNAAQFAYQVCMLSRQTMKAQCEVAAAIAQQQYQTCLAVSKWCPPPINTCGGIVMPCISADIVCAQLGSIPSTVMKPVYSEWTYSVHMERSWVDMPLSFLVKEGAAALVSAHAHSVRSVEDEYNDADPEHNVPGVPRSTPGDAAFREDIASDSAYRAAKILFEAKAAHCGIMLKRRHALMARRAASEVILNAYTVEEVGECLIDAPDKQSMADLTERLYRDL